jgi:3-oxoacyl-[acyl-carrier protein] reductase
MDLGLTGRRAVITGATQGIGKAIAERFAVEGANVVLVARSIDGLDSVAEELRSHNTQVDVIAADLATPQGVERCVDLALTAGPVGILVNNAGGMESTKSILDLTDDDWSASFELNLMSAVRLSRGLLPGMLERGWGRIVNIASIGGREPGPNIAHYSSAKAALISFSKSMSQAYSRQGVLSNVIVPGLVRTPALEQSVAAVAEARGVSFDDALARIERFRPASIGRIGEPDEVATAAVFLASEHASFISGAALSVDGGTILAPY